MIEFFPDFIKVSANILAEHILSLSTASITTASLNEAPVGADKFRGGIHKLFLTA